jgi:hypothetical protein
MSHIVFLPFGLWNTYRNFRACNSFETFQCNLPFNGRRYPKNVCNRSNMIYEGYMVTSV